MALAPGTHLGQYEVTALIGAGGMGEVYRARDTKLNRDVALKVLPDAFANDPDRLSRFTREAQTLAALNDSRIAHIHGLEDIDGVRALVMEFVDGEDLAQRLRRGPIALHDALEIAQQIAEGLEAAHGQGIIHRDLKPANIKLTSSRSVKILDFGLAKAMDSTTSSAGAALSYSPTMTSPAAMTAVGVILGTAAYMSPEQARGLPIDQRTDVWAFGCVLYELLTGRAPFHGPTTADIVSAVLEHEPDWSRLPGTTPHSIRRLLQRCLQKDRPQRMHDIGDVRILIDDALDGPEAMALATAGASASRGRQLAMLLAIAAVGLLAVIVLKMRVPQQAPSNGSESMRLSISTPSPIVPQLSATISPDGRQVAWVATDPAGKTLIWVRTLAALEAHALVGTDGAIHPFWSPNSRAIGFVADNKLKRIGVIDGSIQTLTDTERGGGTWSADDVILFTRGFTSGLWKIPAGGGTPSQVTTVDEANGEYTHAWPQFLPDGRHFLYFVQSRRADKRGVYVGALDSPRGRQLLATDFQGAYAPPGYLLFLREETLMAQPFDPNRLELSGDAAPVAEGVWTAQGAGRAAFTASANGTLAYANASLWNTQLAWFDRRGRLLEPLAAPDRYQGQIPQISPDNDRVAIARGLWQHEQIGIINTNDGISTRLAFEGIQTRNPVWSADGRRIMFVSKNQSLQWTIRIRNASGAGDEEVVFAGQGTSYQLDDWSRDGRYAVLSVSGSNALPDLWLLPLEGEGHGHPVPFQTSPAADYQAQISPDGRWIAYASGESGREEVYAQRFPDKGSKQQVSAAGGNQPRWRADGKELFYVAADNRLTAVAVTSTTTLELGSRTALFPAGILPGDFSSKGEVGPLYDVSGDGQRFLMNVRPTDLGAPITIVTNWFAALKK